MCFLMWDSLLRLQASLLWPKWFADHLDHQESDKKMLPVTGGRQQNCIMQPYAYTGRIDYHAFNAFSEMQLSPVVKPGLLLT